LWPSLSYVTVQKQIMEAVAASQLEAEVNLFLKSRMTNANLTHVKMEEHVQGITILLMATDVIAQMTLGDLHVENSSVELVFPGSHLLSVL